MSSDAQKIVIKALAEKEGLRTSGFSQALRDLFRYKDEKTGKVEDGEMWEIYQGSKFLPAAFKIDKEEKVIWVYEVEMSASMADYKRSRMANMWFYLDCEFWDLKLMVASSHKSQGGKYLLNEVSLQRQWYDDVQEDIRRRRAG